MLPLFEKVQQAMKRGQDLEVQHTNSNKSTNPYFVKDLRPHIQIKTLHNLSVIIRNRILHIGGTIQNSCLSKL